MAPEAEFLLMAWAADAFLDTPRCNGPCAVSLALCVRAWFLPFFSLPLAPSLSDPLPRTLFEALQPTRPRATPSGRALQF